MHDFRHGFHHSLVGLALLAIAITSCGPRITQEQYLRQLHVESAEQFRNLPTCEQVEIYAMVGAEYLDVDHAVALVPTWMNNILRSQSQPEVARCIADQGEIALSELSAKSGNHAFTSGKIHALVYKAVELELLDFPDIRAFLREVVCESKVDYKGRIIIVVYVPQPGESPNLNVSQKEAKYCQ